MRGVSIIMPCYNTEGTQLIEAVQSVYGQGLENNQFEILIVNDGSTRASTLKALQQVKDWPNVQMFHQENKGQSAARNVALANAKFDCSVGLDSDDCFNSDPDFVAQHGSYLKRAMQTLEESPSVSFVYCRYFRFGAVPKSIEYLVPYSVERHLVHGISGVYSVYRTEEMRRAGGYAENLSYSEDRISLIALQNQRLKEGQGLKTIKFSEPYYSYRIHAHGQNVNARPKDYKSLYLFAAQAYPEIHQNIFGSMSAEKMTEHLMALRHKLLSETRFRLTAIFCDPAWAIRQAVPFIARRVKLAYGFAFSAKGAMAYGSETSTENPRPLI